MGGVPPDGNMLELIVYNKEFVYARYFIQIKNFYFFGFETSGDRFSVPGLIQILLNLFNKIFRIINNLMPTAIKKHYF